MKKIVNNKDLCWPVCGERGIFIHWCENIIRFIFCREQNTSKDLKIFIHCVSEIHLEFYFNQVIVKVLGDKLLLDKYLLSCLVTELTSVPTFSSVSSVQSLSHVWLFATPWTAARQASLIITNSRSLLKLTCIESVMPSSHLILCRPLLLLPPNPPSIRVFCNESALCFRWPKYWSFNFNINLSNEQPGLISFRMDWLDLLAVQGTLKNLLQHNSSKASIFWLSAFFIVQLSLQHSVQLSIHDHWKNHSLD